MNAQNVIVSSYNGAIFSEKKFYISERASKYGADMGFYDQLNSSLGLMLSFEQRKNQNPLNVGVKVEWVNRNYQLTKEIQGELLKTEFAAPFIDVSVALTKRYGLRSRSSALSFFFAPGVGLPLKKEEKAKGGSAIRTSNHVISKLLPYMDIGIQFHKRILYNKNKSLWLAFGPYERIYLGGMSEMDESVKLYFGTGISLRIDYRVNHK